MARSLNIPAIRMLSDYGVEKFHNKLQKIGMSSLTFHSEHYGLSLILGGCEGELWELTGIYASMARTLTHYTDYSGRYDKLVEFLDGKPTPAVGFALGIERIMELVVMPKIEREGYYLGAMDESAIDSLFPLASKKRSMDRVTLEYSAKKLKAHLKGADKVNARYCAVVGEDEFKDGTIWVKDLVEKQEFTIKQEEF